MSRSTKIEINPSALTHNLQRVREFAPNSKIMAMIKANAYGHGTLAVTTGLSDADGFGLINIDKAIELRKSGIAVKILLLQGCFNAADLNAALEYDLDIVVHNHQQIKYLQQSNSTSTINIWLKCNTGMNRLGFSAKELPQALEQIQKLPSVKIECLMTHFASANTPGSAGFTKQLANFQKIHKLAPELPISLASSAGIINFPEIHGAWVRPGIMLYGGSPLSDTSASELNLLPAMQFSTELISVYNCSAGDSVGYNEAWTCPEAMPIGLATVGYGDGYPRHLPSGTPVLVNNKLVSLIGMVSMDIIALDLRGCADAKLGDPVVLWGDNLAVDAVASLAGTISYELLSQITARVTRTQRT